VEELHEAAELGMVDPLERHVSAAIVSLIIKKKKKIVD